MNQTALILGDGPCARQVGKQLSKRGIELICLSDTDISEIDEKSRSDDPDKPVRQFRGELLSVKGTAGNFLAVIKSGAVTVQHTVGVLIVAEEDRRVPAAARIGIGLSQAVRPLGELNGKALQGAMEGVQTAVLVCGLGGESTPSVTREVMQTAQEMQTRHGIQTFLLTGNLKVAGDGLEMRYREIKAAGTQVFKFDAKLPRFEQHADGRVTVSFEDPVTGLPCRLSPDLCVVDEEVRPSPRLALLAEILELPLGPDGFIQSDNVHRQTVYTLRKGILAVGPSRCVQAAATHQVDALNAALAAYNLLRTVPDAATSKALIDTSSCVRCLTCHRLCPYRAITIGTRVQVEKDACEGCGICGAECPRRAIRIEGLERADIAAALSARPAEALRMTAFCCSHSAAQAAKTALCAGYRLPVGMTVVDVPCAGAISLEHLLDALANGSDGVLVLTCHLDNCHSERGNRLCHDRVEHLREVLPAVGFDPRRLAVATLAANMGREFSDIALNFETDLASLATRNGA